MRICLLGPITVTDKDDRALLLPGKQGRALLAVLALADGRVVSTARLIDCLWPHQPPTDPANALQTQISRLRKTLGDRVASHPQGYMLTGVDTDVAQFRALVKKAQPQVASHPESTVELLSEALELWKGEPLSDLGTPEFTDSIVTSLRSEHDHAYSLLIDAALASGQADTWLGHLAGHISTHPLDERAVSQYMRALTAAGRPGEALEVYESTRARLADELGIDPSQRLASTHLEILRGQENPSQGSAAASPDPVQPLSEEVTPPELPLALSSFIGREHDLETVTNMLQYERLVTLTGPGGAGKTRLALETGRRVASLGEREVRLVELAPVNDPAQIPQLILNAVQVAGTSRLRETSEVSAQLRSALDGRPLLLIIDNCEHLLSQTAQVVRELLSHAPQLLIVATSRQPFSVPGEAAYPVASMPYPRPTEITTAEEALHYPAIELLTQRAQSFAPRFRLTDANVADIAHICAAIDGLPLALELAAARLRAMSPADVVHRLDQRFRLFTTGDSSAENRQQTLRAVVDWSWELLTEPEQTLLARLSVFNGPTALVTIEAVCGGEPAVVSQLVDKSLVQMTDEGRYVLLETIKEYADAKLRERPGDIEWLYTAHADYFADLAQQAGPYLITRDQVEWLQVLAADHDNIVIAIYRMIDADEINRAYQILAPTGWYWWMRGHRYECVQLVERLWELRTDETGRYRPEIDKNLLVEVATAGVWGAWDGSRDPKSVLPRIDEAHRLIREYNLDGAAPVMKMLPLLRAFIASDEPETLRQSDLLLEIEPALWVRGLALIFRTFISSPLVSEEETEQDITAAMEIFEQLGERFGIIMIYGTAGERRHRQGRISEARQYLEKATRAEAELGAPRGYSVINYSLWLLRAERDDPQKLLEVVRTERENAIRVNNRESILASYVAELMCLRRLGELNLAHGLLRDTETQLKQYTGLTGLHPTLYQEMLFIAEELDDDELTAHAKQQLRELE